MLLLVGHHIFRIATTDLNRLTAHRTDFFFAADMMISTSLRSAASASASACIIFFLAEAEPLKGLTVALELPAGTPLR